MSPSTNGRCYCCHYLSSYWSHEISADKSPSRNCISRPGVVVGSVLAVGKISAKCWQNIGKILVKCLIYVWCSENVGKIFRTLYTSYMYILINVYWRIIPYVSKTQFDIKLFFSDQIFILAFHSLYLYYFLHWYTVSSQPDYYTHHLLIYIIIYCIHINNINTIYIHLYV